MEEGEDRHGKVASASRKLAVDSSGSFAEAAAGRKWGTERRRGLEGPVGERSRETARQRRLERGRAERVFVESGGKNSASCGREGRRRDEHSWPGSPGCRGEGRARHRGKSGFYSFYCYRGRSGWNFDETFRILRWDSGVEVSKIVRGGLKMFDGVWGCLPLGVQSWRNSWKVAGQMWASPVTEGWREKQPAKETGNLKMRPAAAFSRWLKVVCQRSLHQRDCWNFWAPERSLGIRGIIFNTARSCRPG